MARGRSPSGSPQVPPPAPPVNTASSPGELGAPFSPPELNMNDTVNKATQAIPAPVTRSFKARSFSSLAQSGGVPAAEVLADAKAAVSVANASQAGGTRSAGVRRKVDLLGPRGPSALMSEGGRAGKAILSLGIGAPLRSVVRGEPPPPVAVGAGRCDCGRQRANEVLAAGSALPRRLPSWQQPQGAPTRRRRHRTHTFHAACRSNEPL